MPLDTTRMVLNGHATSADMKQYADLFTGVMVDQPVTLGNSLRVNSSLTVVQGTNLNSTLQVNGTATLQGAAVLQSTLQVTGGTTLSGPTTHGASILFATDNANDIGTTAANRPRSIYAGSTVAVPTVTATLVQTTNLTASGTITAQQFNVGSANEHLRNPPNAATHMLIESTDGYGFFGAKQGVHLGGNAWWDGTNWQRYDTTTPSAVFIASAGTFLFQTSAAGTGPLAQATKISIDNTGILTSTTYVRATGFATGASMGAGWPIAGDINATRGTTGYVFLGDSNHYVGFDGASYQMVSGPLNVGGGVTATSAQINGAATVTSTLTVNSNIVVPRGNRLIFTDTNSTIWINTDYHTYFDSWNTAWTFRNAALGFASEFDVAAGGNITLGGTFMYFQNNGGIFHQWDGTYHRFSHSLCVNGATVVWGGNAAYYITATAPWMQIGPNINNIGVLANNGQIGTASSYDSGAHGNGYLAPNNNPGGVGLAQTWSTWSCVDHAIEYGLPVGPVVDPLGIVNAIHGYYYEHVQFEDANHTLQRTSDGGLVTAPLYGFKASEVAEYLPELVGFDRAGNPESIDIDRMVVVLWEAFKQHLQECHV